jgi:hypothetical protein
MASELVTKKKLVDRFVWEIACQKRNRFTASSISKTIGVELDFVKERLLKLSNEGQLFINFEIACASNECGFRTIEKYSKLDDIPIGKIIECPECGEEFVVDREHVWVTYSPNTNYYDKDMCKDIEAVKKKRCITV